MPLAEICYLCVIVQPKPSLELVTTYSRLRKLYCQVMHASYD